MITKQILKAFFVLAITLISISSAIAQDFKTEVDAYLKSEYPANGPGVSFLVSKNGKTIYQEAFGMANLELNVSMTPNNVFEIGSMTKQFTAVSILILTEQGKLNLEDDITKYIPDYPTQGKKITIRHLLNHTSGIKSYTGMPNFKTRAKTDMSPKELIDVFKNEPMDFAPGDQYKYNNSGYVLLGYIIEIISGDTYANFLENNIFKPLGMNATHSGSKKEIVINRASGYSEIENGFENADYLSLTIPYAAGSIMSTTGDLLKWQNALSNHTLIKSDSYEMAIHGSTLNDGTHIPYGFGLEEGNINGTPSIHHGGGIFGYTSMGIYLPHENIFVTGLTNCDCKSISTITAKIASIVIGKPFPDKKDAIKLSDGQLKKWIGTYKFENDVIRFITLENDQLYSQREGRPKYELYPLTPSHYIFEDGTQSYTFSDNNGVKEINFITDGNSYPGIITDRLPPTAKVESTLPPEALAQYVGKYELAPTMVLEITTKESKIYGQLTGQPSFEMFAEKPDVFFLKVVDAQLVFNRKGNDQITDLILFQNGREIPGKKIE
ncbi:serine hydrolase [Gelidibacter sp.]|uniref:serine hydrolase n=1 Tax=Gelidibacter sp. TaxID=2018083 RepID=UPI002CDC828F|nr:serine hydrolase [Gelidibacter sp.]HUH27502.1 serine hydrolase [Gelidibacter sp.]